MSDREQVEQERTVSESSQNATESANYMQVVGGICYAHGKFEGQGCPQWPKCATDPKIYAPREVAIRELVEAAQLKHLAYSSYESMLARIAKYDDPRNLTWNWEDVTDKWERHALNAVRELQRILAAIEKVKERHD